MNFLKRFFNSAAEDLPLSAHGCHGPELRPFVKTLVKCLEQGDYYTDHPGSVAIRFALETDLSVAIYPDRIFERSNNYNLRYGTELSLYIDSNRIPMSKSEKVAIADALNAIEDRAVANARAAAIAACEKVAEYTPKKYSEEYRIKIEKDKHIDLCRMMIEARLKAENKSKST